MANNRTYNVQELTTNSVSVGGLATLGLDGSYGRVIASTPDGAFGAEDVDRAGLKVAASLSCSDVTKAALILDGTVGDTTFRGRESAAATYHNYTVPGIVWSGMNMNFPKGGDGTLQCNGVVRFADGTKKLEDIIALTAADATAQSLTYPVRLYRPHNASFTPEGGSAIAPVHVQSLSLALTGNLIEDDGDDDIGQTGVDLTGWNALQVTLGFRDVVAVSPSHIAAELLGADRGVLTVDLIGRAEADDRTLTINNLLWTGSSQNDKADYTDFTLTGQGGWREKTGPVDYDLTGTPLFSFA